MGIDYVLELDCAAKRALTTDRIVQLVKARSRAEVILEMSRNKGDQRPPSQITFKVAMNRNGRIETTDVSVQSLLDQAAGLDAHRGGCASCPANRDRANGYGCYDSIGYPLEPDTERFLLSRLPAQLDSAAGYMFTSAMRDFAWDGGQAAAMRLQGETFFRLREAPVRRWPELAITGDQVFHMMFHLGNLGTTHAMMLCMFFGMVSLEDDAEPQDAVAPESENARQMIAFLNALAFAARDKLEVLIDG